MNNFKKFFIFYIYYIIFLTSYGKKLYSYTPYHRYSSSLDETEPMERKVLNLYSEIAESPRSPQTEQLFETYADMPKKTLQKSTLNENSERSQLKFDSTNDKALEMEVGEHLVKVKSKKVSKNLVSAPVGGGYDISINPKYSHVIEIIHRGKNINKQDKPAQIYGPTVKKQPLELPKIIQSEKQSEDGENFEQNANLDLEEFSEADEGATKKFSSEVGNEDFSETGEGDAEEFNEAGEVLGNFNEADEGDSEEFGKSNEEVPEEFSEADAEDPEEFGESNEGDPEEFSEADEGDPEEFGEADEGDPEEFGEADEGEPEEFGEADEGDPEEFSEADEKDPEEFSKAEERDPGEFSEADEDDNEKFGESIEKDFEEFGESDGYPEGSKKSEEYPEKLNEVNELYPGELGDHKEFESKTVSEMFSPNDMEDIIEFVEDTNNVKQNGTGNEQTTSTKDELALNEEFEGSGEEFSNANGQNNSKTGRILSMFSRQNETFPTCTTPKGEAGHCRRLGECLLSEALNNFNGFLQQLCLIRGALVGICCPDNPVIETVNPDENATSELMSEDIKQPPEGCGLNTKTRIVGGTISVPHEWTWMVALMRRNRFYCGGVIINNWYILTAAHCVMGMNVKDLSVRLGEYDFNEQSKHTEDLTVSEIKRHAQFVTLTFQHDIALLKLKRSIKYSKYVGSICLPEQKARDYSNAKGTVVGWGTVSFGGAASPILRQVTVPVWKNADCDRTYLLESIGDSFMCAGSPEKGEDACQGDSGGPLMTVSESGRWEVIGLVSWGRRCGDPTYPGVYTRVTTYLDWIKQNAV